MVACGSNGVRLFVDAESERVAQRDTATGECLFSGSRRQVGLDSDIVRDGVGGDVRFSWLPSAGWVSRRL